MLSLEERIVLAAETQEFVAEKVAEIGRQIEKTTSDKKLTRLWNELNQWKEKLNREENTIKTLLKESGHSISENDDWKN